MKVRPLGGTGIQVSQMCFGTLTMSPLQKNMSVKAGAALFELAFSLGVNFIDTAELYLTYPHVREALRIKPDAVICTKAYAYDEQTAEASFRAAVHGMGREYIDVFLLHEQESEHTIRGHWEAVEYFLKRKARGEIGAVGLSTHHVAAMRAANRVPEMEVVFPILNHSGLGIADGALEDMLHVTREAHEKQKGVIAMKPFGGGHFHGTQALQYLLDEKAVDSIAIGMQSEAEIRYNCAVFSGQEPDEHDKAQLDARPRRLMIHDWCIKCGACVQRCKSGALSLTGERAAVEPEKCVLCGYCAAVCPQFCIKVI